MRQNDAVTEHPSVSPESGHGLERVIFFSDAVIAIALTLLALELGVPAAHDSKTLSEDFWDKMGHEYPAFLISFAVIAMFWFNHHRLFRYVARLSATMIVLNTAGLLVIVLMPFATKLTWELEGDAANAWGTAFYAFLMCLWAALYLLMVAEARRSDLWAPSVPPATARTMAVMNVAAFSPFLLSIPVAFVDNGIAKYIWILAGVVPVITGRIRDRRQRHAAASEQAHEKDTESESATV
jgi:uncharacterized membrane protein